MQEFVKTGTILDSELKLVMQEVSRFRHKSFKATLYINKISNGLSEVKRNRLDESSRKCMVYPPKPIESKNIFNILQSYILQEYTKCPFTLTNVSEIQYAEYNPGGLFKWHSDLIDSESNNYRLFSMCMNITPSDSYTGGDLEILNNNQVIRLNRSPGSYIIFPSFLRHQVCEVLTGTRESIVVWVQSSLKEVNRLKTMYTKY